MKKLFTDFITFSFLAKAFAIYPLTITTHYHCVLTFIRVHNS
jgi:hypothetical protein